MEVEIGGTRSIIDERHSSDIHGDLMEDGNGVIRSIIDEVYSWDIQRYQMDG